MDGQKQISLGWQSILGMSLNKCGPHCPSLYAFRLNSYGWCRTTCSIALYDFMMLGQIDHSGWKISHESRWWESLKSPILQRAFNFSVLEVAVSHIKTKNLAGSYLRHVWSLGLTSPYMIEDILQHKYFCSTPRILGDLMERSYN